MRGADARRLRVGQAGVGEQRQRRARVERDVRAVVADAVAGAAPEREGAGGRQEEGGGEAGQMWRRPRENYGC